MVSLLLLVVSTFGVVMALEPLSHPTDQIFGLPDEDLNVTQIIHYHGYPFEIHEAETEDGFILCLVRIPHGRDGGAKKSKGPVFVQHGLLNAADTWVMNGPQQSLAFILADAGYDVWLGNSRGNTYSRKHVKYTVDDKEFWDFTFDEMAEYDNPAAINYVLNVTDTESLYYVGHSQGTMIGFAGFSKLGKKIKMFFALAPVAKIKNIKGAVEVLSKFDTELEFMFKLFGFKEFLPDTWISWILAKTVCYEVTFLCSNTIFLIAGYDRSNFNKTRVPVYIAHNPAGTSVKNILHYAQMVRSGIFQKFDYGKAGNQVHYKQDTPPLYAPEEMLTPVMMYTGGNDWLADPRDVLYLIDTVPNIIGLKNIDHYSHLDFVWGEDMYKHTYADIVKRMDAE